MKNKDHGIDQLIQWSQDRCSPVVSPLSEEQRHQIIGLWRREELTNRRPDPLIAILRWSVSCAIVIMILTIVASLTSPTDRVGPEASLGMAFESERSIVLYVP